MNAALVTWKKKLDYLQQQEAIVADPALKFALAEQIKEAKTKIAELNVGESGGASLVTSIDMRKLSRVECFLKWSQKHPMASLVIVTAMILTCLLAGKMFHAYSRPYVFSKDDFGVLILHISGDPDCSLTRDLFSTLNGELGKEPSSIRIKVRAIKEEVDESLGRPESHEQFRKMISGFSSCTYQETRTVR